MQVGQLKREYCYAFFPTFVEGKLIWGKWYYKIYQFKDIDIVQCKTTDPTERCTLEPGYKKWVLIGKQLHNEK